mmetsp:Transcript_20064/g.44682  ORF Transcript_20064/g.44682 Transcript_20064/m.44682 type:complete len:466 (+) Transcript_20064:53-1450(+)
MYSHTIRTGNIMAKSRKQDLNPQHQMIPPNGEEAHETTHKKNHLPQLKLALYLVGAIATIQFAGPSRAINEGRVQLVDARGHHQPSWVADAFVAAPPLPSRQYSYRPHAQTAAGMVSTSDSDLDALRKEIEELRKEALVRIEEVSIKADNVLSVAPDVKREAAAVVERTSSTVKPTILSDAKKESDTILPPIKSSSQREKIDVTETVHASEKALVGTYWKVALDIGREPGTWMPSDWGVSGQRLMLQLQIQFRDDFVVGSREDFLGDRGGSLVHVVQNDGVVGPTLSQSGEHVRFKDGAWTISRGEGPAGTDLLRFYVELEEKVERGDVYCPAGKIFLTCGYFDIAHRGHSRKRDLEKKLEDLADEHNNILDALNEEGFFSLKRMQTWTLLQQKKADIEKTKDQLQRIMVMEPDMNLLRLSRKRDIGITNEGGACCKVKKGAGYYEYHILGKFQAASVEHGEDTE